MLSRRSNLHECGNSRPFPIASQNAETLFTGDVAKVLQILSPDAFGVLYSSYLAWIDDAESASRTYGDVMRAASSLQEGQRRFSAAEIVLRRTIGTQADISRAKDDVDDLAIQAAEGEGTDGSDNRVAESYLRLCLDTQGRRRPICRLELYTDPHLGRRTVARCDNWGDDPTIGCSVSSSRKSQWG